MQTKLGKPQITIPQSPTVLYMSFNLFFENYLFEARAGWLATWNRTLGPSFCLFQVREGGGIRILTCRV